MEQTLETHITTILDLLNYKNYTVHFSKKEVSYEYRSVAIKRLANKETYYRHGSAQFNYSIQMNNVDTELLELYFLERKQFDYQYDQEVTLKVSQRIQSVSYDTEGNKRTLILSFDMPYISKSVPNEFRVNDILISSDF